MRTLASLLLAYASLYLFGVSAFAFCAWEFPLWHPEEWHPVVRFGYLAIGIPVSGLIQLYIWGIDESRIHRSHG